MEPFQSERGRWFLQWQHSKNIMSAGCLYLSGQLFQDDSSVYRTTCISLSLWTYLEGNHPITDIYISGIFVFFISYVNLLNSVVKLNWSNSLVMLPPRLTVWLIFVEVTSNCFARSDSCHLQFSPCSEIMLPDCQYSHTTTSGPFRPYYDI